MKFISKLLSGGAAGLLDTVGGVVDKLSTSKEERMGLDLEMKKAEQQHTLEMSRLSLEEKRLLRPYPPLKGGCVSRSLRFSYALVQPRKRPPSSTFLQPLVLKKRDKDEFSLFLEAGNSGLSFRTTRIE